MQVQHVSAGIIFVISFHRSYLLASVITSEYYLFSGRLNKYERNQAGCTAQAVWGTIQRRISPATVVSRGKTHPGEVLMLRTAGFEIPGAKVENVQRTFAIERRRRVRWSCSGFFAKKKKKKAPRNKNSDLRDHLGFKSNFLVVCPSPCANFPTCAESNCLAKLGANLLVAFCHQQPQHRCDGCWQVTLGCITIMQRRLWGLRWCVNTYCWDNLMGNRDASCYAIGFRFSLSAFISW